MSRVVVVDYDPCWPDAFEELAARVREAVGDVALSVEHVGSTAVPGLPAKPVIDMDVVVRDGDVPRVIERLAELGYAHRGDLGIAGREAFRAPKGLRAHNLYVCPEQSPALLNHRAVRDHLRGNPDVARQYGALKRRLAEEFPKDMDGYIEGKTAFLLAILREEGLNEDKLKDIEAMNRADTVLLRPVEDGDLALFFRYENEPESIRMAAFTSKDPSDRDAFDEHWAKIRASSSVRVRTIQVRGEAVGSVLSYEESELPEVSFWIGSRYWGRGIATEALRAFLSDVDTRRPMRARAAKDNARSLRVLEKCGFRVSGEDRGFANGRGEEVDEFVLELRHDGEEVVEAGPTKAP